MHKIKKDPLLGILIYTAILTALIVFSFSYFLQKSGSMPYTSSNTLYLSKSLSVHGEFINKENSHTNKPISATSLKSYYQSSFYDNLPLFIMVVVLIIFGLTSLLWFYIRHKEVLKTTYIAKDVRALSELDELPQDSELQSAYDEIHNYVMNQQHNYEVMHSYIMHEQKNLITLISAKLSLHQDQSIDSNIQSLSNSIDDILTLSTAKATSLDQVDLALLSASVVDEYRSIYPSITFTFDEDREYLIAGKEHWLRRALDNLLNNAIKYGNQGSVEVSLTQEKQSIQLKIRDYGMGIADQELERIFDFRYQIQDLKKDGYGIGLSLVKHVADLCNGAIWVESTLQQGTSFIISFPLLKIN